MTQLLAWAVMVMTTSEQPFKGTTHECLEHFFANNEWELASACLSRFTQVQRQTVRKWRAKDNMPLGVPLLRVRVFLDLLGYHVKEFTTLADVTKDFGRLIVFDQLSAEEARQLLQYTKRNGVLGVLLRGYSLQRERIYKMERLVEDSSDELDRLTQKFKKQIRDDLQLGDEQDVPEEQPPIAQLNLSGYVSLGDPIVAAVLTTITSAEAVISMLDWNSQADELVDEIAKRVDFADLVSLIASLEAIKSVVVHGSSESQ